MDSTTKKLLQSEEMAGPLKGMMAWCMQGDWTVGTQPHKDPGSSLSQKTLCGITYICTLKKKKKKIELIEI